MVFCVLNIHLFTPPDVLFSFFFVPVVVRYPGPEQFYGHNAEPLKHRDWTRRTPTDYVPGIDPPPHIEWDPVFRGPMHPIGFSKVIGWLDALSLLVGCF